MQQSKLARLRKAISLFEHARARNPVKVTLPILQRSTPVHQPRAFTRKIIKRKAGL